jgi:hypothetical protein
MNKMKLMAMMNKGYIRRQVVVDNTANASKLVGYPVAVNLTASNWNFSRAAANGSNIRFYEDSSQAMLLPHWIESYSNVSKTARIWVYIPSIPANGTRTVYMTAGGSPATSLTPDRARFHRPAVKPTIGGLVENMAYDSVTALYYVVTSETTDGPIDLYSAPHPTGPWTSVGTILALGAGGTWDDYTIYAPHLIKDGATWYLFYSGGPDNSGNSHSIGYATAAAVGGPYTRYGSNPVISYGGGAGDFDRYRACEPWVQYSNILGKYICLYMGDAGAGATQVETVGYATADTIDGIWTKHGKLIDFGPVGSWDRTTVADPFMVEIGGVAYIGYTGGNEGSAAMPWWNGFAKTTDFVTVTKLGQMIMGNDSSGWDVDSGFRGGILQVGNNYYMPYTGRSGDGWIWDIAVATATLTAKGFDMLHVFDFGDDFNGAAVDTTLWSVTSGTGASEVVANSLLTTSQTAGSGTYLSRNTWLNGKIAEFYALHPKADGVGTGASEEGISTADRASCMRLFDYNHPNWDKASKYSGTETTSQMGQAVDKLWHVRRIKRVSQSSVLYSIDANTDEEITTNIPIDTLRLPLWMFMYNSGAITLDWVRLRQYTTPEPTITLG